MTKDFAVDLNCSARNSIGPFNQQMLWYQMCHWWEKIGQLMARPSRETVIVAHEVPKES